MSDLVVIVPSRGRPQAVAELAAAFRETCVTNPQLVFAVDESDPVRDEYTEQMMDANGPDVLLGVMSLDSTSMVEALNKAARATLARPMNALVGEPKVIAFMGDDHRPRTRGWDAAYLAALAEKPGLVYGNDLLQGANLPTQVAMSAEVVRALGHMAPPVLTHLYVDNYWLQLGRAADCITYLPDVIVEHLHPVARKAEWDEGYKRVNDSAMYERDAAAFAAYWSEHGPGDVAKVRDALSVAARG
ncbi:MAG TPA: hypothetical protein VIV12_11535 [Streptosporangiaceae bacterium]